MRREPTITQNTSAGDQREERREPDSTISTKTFIGTTGAALTVLMLMLFATVSLQTVTAAFSPGIGGINASFGTLAYNDTTAGVGHPDAHIYPTTNPSTAACPGVTASAGNEIPVLTADVPGTVSVQQLFLNKTINTTTGAPFPVVDRIDNITVSIAAAETTSINLDDPTLEFSSLSADQLDLSGGVRIYENYSNGTTQAPYLGPEGEFHINASNLEVDGATAFAHLIAFQSISLPNQELSLVFNKQGAEQAIDSCDV